MFAKIRLYMLIHLLFNACQLLTYSNVFDWKPQRPLAFALNSISLKFVHENCSLKINRSIIVEYPMYKRQSMTITFSYKYTPHTPKSRLSNANTSFHLGLLISDLACTWNCCWYDDNYDDDDVQKLSTVPTMLNEN